MIDKRRLGSSEIEVSTVAMGCWPIAGMTSLDVNEKDSVATLLAAREAGVNFFDTAYCYGRDGESERLIGRVFASQREQIVVATKGGLHWGPDGSRVIDGRPATLRKQLEESLRRLNTAYVDLLYLHAPDPDTPVQESAVGLRELLDSGKARAIGVSNFSVEQMQQFAAECPLAAVQPPYNMLQRQIETDLLPWCRDSGVSVVVYWPLLKGLLAGKLGRDHVFAERDGRAKYPMFQGQEWQRNQDLLDELKTIAADVDCPLAELVVAWTLRQPGVTAALCGAKRPYQIEESAAAMSRNVSDMTLQAIEAALHRRGTPIVRSAV